MTPNIEIEDKKFKSRVMLLLLRCEYIAGPVLTKKGRGIMPTWFWVKYNDVMCFISKKHRNYVFEILDYLKRKEEVENNVNKMLNHN